MTGSLSLPDRWTAVRLKYAADRVNEKVEAFNGTYIGLENVSSGTGRFVPTDDVEVQGLSLRFRPGSVLFGKLRPYLAKSLLVQEPGVCSSEFLVLNGRELSGQYLHYLTLSPEFVTYVDSTTYGAKMPRANWADISAFETPVPPIDEQRAIADFLDRETAKIDTLIEKQERLIELLEEKRQAVITRAVTKGLNPDVRMKDSGVEWLGEVPAHWTASKVRRVVSFTTSGSRGWSDYVCEVGAVFLQSGNLNSDMSIDLVGAPRVDPPVGRESIRTCLRDGDIVVCITGAKTGKVALVDGLDSLAYVNQHLCLLRPRLSHVLPEYLARVLYSEIGQRYFGSVQYGLKQGLGLEDVLNAPIALPPVSEQRSVAEHIRSEIGQYDRVVSKNLEAVALLRERRTALISAAVTGQIDVRQAV